MATIEATLRANTAETIARAKTAHVRPRQAAVDMARRRIDEARRYRWPYAMS